MSGILDIIQGGVVVSVQAESHQPFYAEVPFQAMAQSVLDGGAAGLRLAGVGHIETARRVWGGKVPVIGITKPDPIPEDALQRVYITPTSDDVLALAQAGADVVAMDATGRERPGGETLSQMVEQARRDCPNLLLMADVSTLEEGVSAAGLGFDVISTTLSGYTEDTSASRSATENEPDFELLAKLASTLSVPIILEGRVWTPAHVREAFSLGAHAVVIGSAITRPHLITRRFTESAEQSPHSVR